MVLLAGRDNSVGTSVLPTSGCSNSAGLHVSIRNGKAPDTSKSRRLASLLDHVPCSKLGRHDGVGGMFCRPLLSTTYMHGRKDVICLDMVAEPSC